MASIRSSSNNTSTTGTAVSVTAPTSTTVGDAVIVSIHCNNNTTIVDNNGSTPFTTDLAAYSPNTVSAETVAIFSRIIQPGDPTTYNFTIGVSGRWSIVAVAIASPNATLYDVSPSTANAVNRDDSTAATLNAPSITTLSTNAIHFVCGYSDDGAGGAMTGPAGYTGQGSPLNEPQIVATKTITAVGATGTQTVTATTSSPIIALSFAIKNPPTSIVINKLIASGSDVSASSFTTASLTIPSNDLILLGVSTRRGDSINPTTPTITGLGLTWVQVDSDLQFDTVGTSRKTLFLFRGMGASATGTILIDFGAQTITNCYWNVDDVSFVNLTGSNGKGAIVQTAQHQTQTGAQASESVTLSNFVSSNNIGYGLFSNDGPSVFTVGAGFTSLGVTSGAGMDGLSEYKLNTPIVSATFTNVVGITSGVIAVEIAAPRAFRFGNNLRPRPFAPGVAR